MMGNMRKAVVMAALQHAAGINPPTPTVTIPREVLERVAKAIEGPHKAMPFGSTFTLEQLRDVRWNHLTDQEQGERLSQARAAIAALEGVV